MRTRKGKCYPELNLCSETVLVVKKRRRFTATVAVTDEQDVSHQKRRREILMQRESAKRLKTTECDFFDSLHDDLVILILGKLSSTANSPPDFINITLTCKRLKELSTIAPVLSKASAKTFPVRANNWSEPAHRYLKLCVDAGNIEACYTLGMIRFYCLQNRASGASLMAKAAINSHAPALYSLALIQFNGSGGSRKDKDLRAGVALCARAAFFGHVDALRELGHCLQDGYGVRQNIVEGRRFLVQANARELASVVASSSFPSIPSWNPFPHVGHHGSVDHHSTTCSNCPLLSDFGCNVPAAEAHPANQFLTDWFAAKSDVVADSGLRMCSHVGCGRPETRSHEFRRCSICGGVNYCSRACQALDWKLRHKAECAPMERWVNDDVDYDGEDNMVIDEN